MGNCLVLQASVVRLMKTDGKTLEYKPSPKASKKKVRFAEPEVELGVQESGVIRIKLVISKQELQHMVHKGGISVNDMLSSLVHGEKGVDNGEDLCRQIDDGSQGWKPALESIPEVNYNYIERS